MADLKSKGWIVAKGLMFLAITIGASGLILLQMRSWSIVLLLLLVAWSAARFYYFLFYVLEKYVDPSLRYAGIFDLVGQLWRKRSIRK